jgi:hypothetical protein
MKKLLIIAGLCTLTQVYAGGASSKSKKNQEKIDDKNNKPIAVLKNDLQKKTASTTMSGKSFEEPVNPTPALPRSPLTRGKSRSFILPRTNIFDDSNNGIVFNNTTIENSSKAQRIRAESQVNKGGATQMNNLFDQGDAVFAAMLAQKAAQQKNQQK